jgi:hypothetical protein
VTVFLHFDRTFRPPLAGPLLSDRFLAGNPHVSGGEQTINFIATWERRQAMAEIRWEKDFSAARERAKAAKKPIYLDFWFEG